MLWLFHPMKLHRKHFVLQLLFFQNQNCNFFLIYSLSTFVDAEQPFNAVSVSLFYFDSNFADIHLSYIKWVLYLAALDIPL